VSNHFAVIGNPIDHSLSPVIHHYFAKQMNVQLSYEKIKGNEKAFALQVKAFFNHGGKGMNVTLPFKQQAFALADQATERCKAAGAANTLWQEKGLLHADNTDGIGLLRDLQRHVSLNNKRILVLGAGGAVRGILLPLLSAKPSFLQVANRTLSNALALQKNFPAIHGTDFEGIKESFDVVINATSASLGNETFTFPEQCFANHPFCYDLTYKLERPTAFVQYARDKGCQSVDGLGMLVEQAAEAFYIWHGMMPETQQVLDKLRS
jgi:shikimate dehydrogenase